MRFPNISYSLLQRMNSLFSDVVLGLAAQGWVRCKSENGDPVLMNRHGHRCAIGYMVPAEILKVDEWDTSSAISHIYRERFRDEIGTRLSAPITELIGQMRQAHDCDHGPENLRIQLSDIADDFGLDWPDSIPR